MPMVQRRWTYVEVGDDCGFYAGAASAMIVIGRVLGSRKGMKGFRSKKDIHDETFVMVA